MASQQAPKCVWVYAVGFELVHYFQTEEDANEWWAVYKEEVDGDVEGAIEMVSLFKKPTPKQDDRPFCLECRGYTCGGLGANEPVCCCDSDEDEEEYICDCSVCGERLYACGSVELAEDADGGGCCAKCAPAEENKPTLLERLAFPTHEEFELLPPEEQRLMLHKLSTELSKATEAEVASAVKAVEAEAEARMKVIEAKKKKPIKLKLKLKKEC